MVLNIECVLSIYTLYFIGFPLAGTVFIPIFKRGKLRFSDYSSLPKFAHLVENRAGIKTGYI